MHEHTYSDTEYEKNEGYHWPKATCGDANEWMGYDLKVEHDWYYEEEPDRSTGSCAIYKTCRVCHFVDDYDCKYKHIFSETEFISDGSYGHYHKAICEDAKDLPASGYGRNSNWVDAPPIEKHDDYLKYPDPEIPESLAVCKVYATCTRCGWKSDNGKTAHTFSTDYKYDATRHWHYAICNDAKWSSAVASMRKDPQEHNLTVPDEKCHIVCTVCSYDTYQHEFDYANGVEDNVTGEVTYKCKKCGVSTTNSSHVHTFDTSVWESDDESHGHPATCGHTARGSEASHNKSSRTDPETEHGNRYYVCSVCNARHTQDHVHLYYKPIDQMPYEYRAYDENTHWFYPTCYGTIDCASVRGDEASHTFRSANNYPSKGDTSEKCTGCAYARNITHEHTYGTSFDGYDGETHWIKATCIHTDEKANEKPHTFQLDKSRTDPVTGHYIYKCKFCDFEYVDPEHIYSSKRSLNETQHGKKAVCKCPDLPIIEIEPHDIVWGKWTHNSYPVGGDRTGKCSCGYSIAEHKHYTAGYFTESNEYFHWAPYACGHVRPEPLDDSEEACYKHLVTMLTGTPVEGQPGTYIGTCEADDCDRENVTCHDHVWDWDNWSGDETYHWHAALCDDTDEVQSKRDHQWVLNGTLDECSVCHYTRDTTHEHTWLRQNDGSGHYEITTCTQHISIRKNLGPHTFVVQGTDKEKGLVTLQCTGCSYSKSHNHTYETGYESDSTQHWHPKTCGCAGSEFKSDHNFGGWSLPDENGTITRTCKSCNYAETGHEHVYKSEFAYDDEQHWHEASCTDTTGTSGRAAHVFGPWTTTLYGRGEDAHMSVDKQRVCGQCGYVQKVHTHKWQRTPIVASTSTRVPGTCNRSCFYYYSPLCDFETVYNEEYTLEVPETAVKLSELGALKNGPSYLGDPATYYSFGVYPQHVPAGYREHVTVNEKIINLEFDDVDYYLGSDNNWYYKVADNAARVGAHTNTGRYNYAYGSATKGDGSPVYVRVDPIIWRVLTTDYDGGKTLLWSKYLLDNVRGYSGANLSYDTSDVRVFLNGDFMKMAFTKEMQDQIATTHVDNSTIQHVTYEGFGSELGCPDTYDKVFLLSAKEISTEEYGFGPLWTVATDPSTDRNYYFNKGHDLRVLKFMDCFVANSGTEEYLLRSPFLMDNLYGRITVGNYLLYDPPAGTIKGGIPGRGGIAPALCLP